MVYIHSFPSRFNIAAAVKANIGEAEEILANWSPDIAEAARALMLRVIVGFQCCSCEEIAAEEPPRLREWLEAWVEYAHTELRAEGDPDARPPAPPEKVDFPTPEVQANSIVVATLAQLARGAGHVEPRSRRPVVVRLPLPRREPVSRRLMARLARPEASRAPPHGNDDGTDSDDPDPDGNGANIIRAFFVFGGGR